MKKNIFLISKYRYPNGDAGALRQHVFAKMFQALGYDATVIALGESTERRIKEYDGVKYISFRYGNELLFHKVLSHLLFGFNLKKFLTKGHVSAIWVNDIPEQSFLQLKKFSKKNNLPIIHDSVEWYSPEQFEKGEKDKNYILKDRLNTVIIDEQVNVVAISRFLERHFINKGCNTLCVPVVLDAERATIEKNIDNEKLILFYAGRPTGKDYLDVMIKGISLLTEDELKKVKFVIRGMTADNIKKSYNIDDAILEKLKDNLVIYGYGSREAIIDDLAKASYTVLVRDPEQRYAKAGFPTKVVESLMYSTPIMCNLSSDLGEYLHDGKNCLIINGNTPEDFAKTVSRALKIETEEHCQMCKNARKLAEEKFDYRIYIDKLKKLI